MTDKQIKLKEVKVHNLKKVDLTLDHHKLIVFTGVSGSGKSSMAFDTLFVEGQRRYIESLSQGAKKMIGDFSKPDAGPILGLSPTVSIEQKTVGKNPRSTVGTLTEIYDYLRVIYARGATAYCPVSKEPLIRQTKENIIDEIVNMKEGAQLLFLAPYAKGKKGEFKEDFNELMKKGYTRVRIDGNLEKLSDTIALDKNVAHDVEIVIDRIKTGAKNKGRLAESATTALEAGGGIFSIVIDNQEERLYSTHGYSPKSGLSYSPLTPQDFSFNSPHGMCETCSGLGELREFDLDKVIDPNKSISEDCCLIASSYQTVRYGNIYDNLAKIFHFDVETPWKKLSKEAKEVFLNGAKKKWLRMRFVHPTKGFAWTDYVPWKGVLYEARKRYSEAKSDAYKRRAEELMTLQVCPDCKGAKLKAYPAAARLGKKTIGEITLMGAREGLAFFESLTLDAEKEAILKELLIEVKRRFAFLIDVGLDYLTLDRKSPTLSGGEAQRVRLASQIGSGLVGVTYILDEPSIGLHPRDNQKLTSTLKTLRDKGNTVVVVEHDEETIFSADEVVDFGPGAGYKGGKIIFSGPLHKFLKSKESLTAAYLRGDKLLQVPPKRRKGSGKTLAIEGACLHNLKKVNLKLPLGMFVAVTGVSGSGKSSLITETLMPALVNQLQNGKQKVGPYKKLSGLDHLDKVIGINQDPIGKNPRSTPATYVKILDAIRDLFALLPESQARGYLPGRFSFNVADGSCPRCLGMGMVKVDMDFLEDAWVECQACEGKRFDAETLSLYYKGKNIAEVLNLTIDEAFEFFHDIPLLHRRLDTLRKVGLGYLTLGQPSPTLSGGESQRIKLSKELSKISTGKTLYILDEPTTGLHFEDILHHSNVLQTLVDKGHTVVVIEHNLDLIKMADHIIDLGPSGGDGGGKIIGEGTPEKVAKSKTETGKALSLHLKEAKPIKRFPEVKPTKAKPIKNPALEVTGACEHNLKNLTLSLPREKISVFTGPSGSGKTSMAFDTIYAEGQRRYSESLSSYARQFIKLPPKPKLEQIDGLSPAIAIEQKVYAGNPRSTVGTMTEIYDFLRLLYSHLGVAYDPETGDKIEALTKEDVLEHILSMPEGEKIQVLAPLELSRGTDFSLLTEKYRSMGYLRLYLNGKTYLLEEEIPFDKKRKNEAALIVDRLKTSPRNRQRLADSIEAALRISKEEVLILDGEEKQHLYRLSFAVRKTGQTYPPLTPQTFSFNAISGMCQDCFGLGTQYGMNLSDHPEIDQAPLPEIIDSLFWGTSSTLPEKMVDVFCKEEKIDQTLPLCDLPAKKRTLVLKGSPKGKWYKAKEGPAFRWLGLETFFARMGRWGRQSVKEEVVPFLTTTDCAACKGDRLNPLARKVELEGKTLPSLVNEPIEESLEFLASLPIPSHLAKVLEDPIKQVKHRLKFLCEVGLGYLSLSRKAPTLSGGETQRIRLARQLGSELTGVLYVLDEPTIGLHKKDNQKLIKALKHLNSLGNTLLMVEHDPDVIEHADYLVDFGPKAGRLGGEITAQGTLKQILKNKNSLTGQYLSGKKQIPPFTPPAAKIEGTLAIKNASKHNLKNLSVNFACGKFTCLTGVSGSGKSTLMVDVLYQGAKEGVLKADSVDTGWGVVSGIDNFTKVLYVDQNPIGLTARSDVCTYVDLLGDIRSFFAKLPEAKIRGLQPKHFSYNHRKGMCTTCYGMGYKKIELQFMPAARVKCPACHGLRLNPVSLGVTYKGLNLGEILQLTVVEAGELFSEHPRIVKKTKTLDDVGLGYLILGQEVATLSGGEAQRLKLSREIQKGGKNKTLYLLDEPTIGLHFEDIEKLLKVFEKLLKKGGTLIVIEHNETLIKSAHEVIELGPGPGAQGGEVVEVVD